MADPKKNPYEEKIPVAPQTKTAEKVILTEVAHTMEKVHQAVQQLAESNREIKKVTIANPQPEIQKVEVTNPVHIPEVQFPEVTNVNVLNKAADLPTGRGVRGPAANPEFYVPVRLTDGERFYKAMDEFFVAATAASSKPAAASSGGGGGGGQVTQGTSPWVVQMLPGVTTAISGSISAVPTPGLTTAVSGTVTIQNNGISATTVSGNAGAGQDYLLTGGSAREYTVSTTTAQTIGTIDCTNLPFVSVHILTQGTSSTVSFQGSNDGVNWVSVRLAEQSTNTFSTADSTANRVWSGLVPTKYFRINVTGISAGTTTCQIMQRSFPFSSMMATVNGNSSTGVTQSTVPWITQPTAGYTTAVSGSVTINGLDSGGAPIPIEVAGSGADAINNAVNELYAAAFGYVYNGATWDRNRSAVAANGSSGTGLPAAGSMGYDYLGTYRAIKTDVNGIQAVTVSGSLQATTISGSYVTPMPTPTGGNGLTPYRNTALSNTAASVKPSAGRVYGFHLFNPNTSDVYVQLYDLASGSVTVGTTVPVWTFWVPAGGAIDKDLAMPMTFLSAITIAATTTATGGTAPSSALLVNLGFI